MHCNRRKVSIIGLGNVGVTAAYAMLLRGGVDEIVLVSRTLEKAEGERLDLEHGLAFLDNAIITATDRYEDIAESDIIVITAGAAQKPGETRLDLAQKNADILKEILPHIVTHAPQAIVLLVSNPVDVLTYQAVTLSGLSPRRVFGSGTMLDTARFRVHLSSTFNVNPRSLHTYILGEHGDSSFPAISSASIGGQPLTTFPGYTEEKMVAAFEQAQKAAYHIIQAKGATYYAIGVVINQLVKTILGDTRSVLPVSVCLNNYYGESNVAASVPCIVGANGIENVLTVQLSENEQAAFHKSCEVIRGVLQTLT